MSRVPALRVIFATEEADAQSDAASLKIAPTLLKPFTFEQLAAAIASMCGAHSVELKERR